MALLEKARDKALSYFVETAEQSEPDLNTEKGSPFRSLLAIPGALTFASIVQGMDEARNLFLGNYRSISRSTMDLIAGNLLQERPSGTQSLTSVKVYLDEARPFSVDAFPYFSTNSGVEFKPVERIRFEVNDILEDDEGIYVRVPVVSSDSGVDNRVAAGQIANHTNFPVSVRRVTNPEPSQGGDRAPSNREFFRIIQRALNNPTINQPDGLRSYIEENYPSSKDIEIVESGDPRMRRDEVWVDENGDPTVLNRTQAPMANTESVQLDFESSFGRAVAQSDVFDEEGVRVSIDGDDEHFRKVLKVISPREAVLSGRDLIGTKQATLWGEGPHIRGMSDAYMYFPSLEISTTVVDRRRRLVFDGDSPVGVTDKIYFRLPLSQDFETLPDSGYVLLHAGTNNQKTLRVQGVGHDKDGDFLDLGSQQTVDLTPDDPLGYTEDGPIDISENGDVDDLPSIYILRVDRLDPVTLEATEEIPRTGPGPYNNPGWYLQTPDPSRLFSTSEKKQIVLDDKSNSYNFSEIKKTGQVTAQSEYYIGEDDLSDGRNTLLVPGEDVYRMEGREDVFLEVQNSSLQGPSDSTGKVGDGSDVNPYTLKFDGINTTFFSDKGFRDENITVTVYEYDGSYSSPKEYDGSEVMLYGPYIQKKEGHFRDFTNYGVEIDFGAAPELYDHAPSMAETIETVILQARQSQSGKYEKFDAQFDPPYEQGLVVIRDVDGYSSTQGYYTPIDITLEDAADNFAPSPVRVTYATHHAIEEIQDKVVNGRKRSLCEEALIRSAYPTLVDMSIDYSGPSSPGEIQNRLIDLLHDSVKNADGRAKISLNNILSRLDDEGLTDKMNVQPEVRVTNYLDDGEYEVRYLNPSESTRQELAVYKGHTPPGHQVNLRRLDSTAPIPGRGRLILGGNDPDRQEIVPYEAVIDQGDYLTFILRTPMPFQYDHHNWETALVTSRDYDPDLEYTDGTIWIPRSNRPYVRHMMVRKNENTR